MTSTLLNTIHQEGDLKHGLNDSQSTQIELILQKCQPFCHY